MPDLSSNLTALRASGHKVRSYLAVFGGVVVASGTLDAAPSQGATALDWTRTAGSSSDIKPGYRVVVENGSGALKFETSVRYSGTISDSNLPIREVATAEFTLSASDVVKVYNVPVLTDKLVEANATFAPDGIAYSNQNTVIAPITTSGGHWAGFVDSGQTYATVVTSGGGSFTVDPDSGGTITHLWTLPTGVAFAGGSSSTDASPTLEANTGYYVVTHTVTDSANSATWTQYLLIRVYDASTRPVECVVEAIDGDQDTGWSGRVRVFSDAAISDIPDRSLVAVFVDETINGSAVSYGNRIVSRSHIKLLGFLRRDENEGGANDDALTFEIISPWARLQEIPGFSKALERYSSTAGWNYVQGLTTKRAIIQILRWYSNWTEFFDLAFNTYTDYDYPAFFAEKNTPLAQLQELADATDARVTGDRTGALLVHTRPELVALASRSSLTTTITLTDDDRITYRFARDHFKVVDTLECRGFTAATTTAGAVPLFSRYPGVPGRGALVTAVDRLIAASQSNLNDRCGLRGAAADGVFITSAGLYHRAVELELTLPGSYDVFDPAYQEWIAFTGASGNRRSLDLSAYRFVLRSVNVTYAGGTATTNLRLVSETAAPAGRTYVPPATTGANPFPDIEFPPIEFPDSGFGNGWMNAGTSRIAAICQYGIARTTNFGSSEATTWDFISWQSIFGSSAYYQAWGSCPDAFSYSGGGVKGWAILSGPGGSLGTWKLVYFNVAAQTAVLKHTFSGPAPPHQRDGGDVSIDASFGSQGFIVASAYSTSAGTYCARSADNTTFTEVQISANLGTIGGTDETPAVPGTWVSSRTPGRAVVQAYYASGLRATHQARATTDYGATWSDTSDPDMSISKNIGAAGLFSPYDPARNPSESIFFWMARDQTAGAGAIGLFRDNGTSSAKIASFLSCAARNPIGAAAGNANRLIVSNQLGNGKTYITNNALDSSPTFTEVTALAGTGAMCNVFAGDNPNVIYAWHGLFRPFYSGVTQGPILLSTDGGATFRSQIGNLPSVSTTGCVLSLMGW